MTYNFDSDQWYENERVALEIRYKSAKMDKDEFRKALSDLRHRYEKMLDRLDGTYQLPK